MGPRLTQIKEHSSENQVLARVDTTLIVRRGPGERSKRQVSFKTFLIHRNARLRGGMGAGAREAMLISELDCPGISERSLAPQFTPSVLRH